MALKLVALAPFLLFTACAGVPNFATDAPPGDYGRPAVVRGFARGGSYLGAAVGVVAWVVTLPVQLVPEAIDEPLGYSRKEWWFLPISTCASAGHYAFGLPAEGLYWLFWGAWVSHDPPETGFHTVPGTKPDR